MNKKLLGIIEGALVIALGVLIAIFGGQAVLDIYFGILFIIAGVALLVIVITALVKTKLLNFGLTFLSFAALVVGSFLVSSLYSFGAFVALLILLVIAAGGALIFHGAYSIGKKRPFYGIGEIVVGAAAITVGILYIFVPEFVKVFWIIVGILVALYGVLLIINAAMSKEE